MLNPEISVVYSATGFSVIVYLISCFTAFAWYFGKSANWYVQVPSSFAFTFCDLTINGETHTVDIVYNYDKDVQEKLKGLINKLPKDLSDFKVNDLELVNYWANRVKNNYKSKLIMFSGELKTALNYGNVEFDIV